MVTRNVSVTELLCNNKVLAMDDTYTRGEGGGGFTRPYSSYPSTYAEINEEIIITRRLLRGTANGWMDGAGGPNLSSFWWRLLLRVTR